MDRGNWQRAVFTLFVLDESMGGFLVENFCSSFAAFIFEKGQVGARETIRHDNDRFLACPLLFGC